MTLLIILSLLFSQPQITLEEKIKIRSQFIAMNLFTNPRLQQELVKDTDLTTRATFQATITENQNCLSRSAKKYDHFVVPQSKGKSVHFYGFKVTSTCEKRIFLISHIVEGNSFRYYSTWIMDPEEYKENKAYVMDVLEVPSE